MCHARDKAIKISRRQSEHFGRPYFDVRTFRGVWLHWPFLRREIAIVVAMVVTGGAAAWLSFVAGVPANISAIDCRWIAAQVNGHRAVILPREVDIARIKAGVRMGIDAFAHWVLTSPISTGSLPLGRMSLSRQV